MKLRKINAVLSLIGTILTLAHAVSLAAWMLSRGSIQKIPGTMAWVLTGAVALHAVISIVLLASGGNSSQEVKTYPKMNVSTVVQGISGILMMIFTGFHIAGAADFMQPSKAVHAIVPPLFFAVVMAHLSVSTSKAFITLGIGNAKTVKVVDIAVKVICAVTLIADITGFYLFVC